MYKLQKVNQHFLTCTVPSIGYTPMNLQPRKLLILLSTQQPTQDQTQPRYKLTFMFCNYQNQWRVDFNMKFDFNYCKNSTSQVFLWRWVCDFPKKIYPTQAISNDTMYSTYCQIHPRDQQKEVLTHQAATFGTCSQLWGFCVLPNVVWIIEALVHISNF